MQIVVVIVVVVKVLVVVRVVVFHFSLGQHVEAVIVAVVVKVELLVHLVIGLSICYNLLVDCSHVGSIWRHIGIYENIVLVG